jgi:hypothetical protein
LSDTIPASCSGTGSPASARASFWWAMFFMRGSSLNPSRCANANPTRFWPWVSVYCRSIAASVQCRSTPSIIADTSDAEHDLSCEYTHTDLRSTCQ